MMRPARFIDTPRIVELLIAQQKRSRFADAVAVDEGHARKLVSAMIQRHGGIHDGATCCYVIESDEGIVEAFIFGMLDRVYHIGDMLTAIDVFLVCTEKAPLTAMQRLLSAYMDWAQANPKVFEIQLSWTDALPTGERMAALYERKGFVKSGEIFRRSNEQRSLAA